MWTLSHPWWEYILRPLVIYAVVFILLRKFVHKQTAELGPFDLVPLLIISESVNYTMAWESIYDETTA